MMQIKNNRSSCVETSMNLNLSSWEGHLDITKGYQVLSLPALKSPRNFEPRSDDEVDT